MSKSIDITDLYAKDVIQLRENNTIGPINFSGYKAEDFFVDKARFNEEFSALANQTALKLEKSIIEEIKCECNPESVTKKSPSV